MVVGRDVELAAVAELLDGVPGGPAVLVLAGEAGIGKTTLWRAGIQAARRRGFQVLACRPAASEVRLSYAGLTDLLAEIEPEAFDLLPRPQRHAVDAALLRAGDDDAVADPRAVASGVLSLVDELARRGPLLVGMDDVQWLDEPTRRVVEFAVRRCRGPVAVLVARRVEDSTLAAAEWRPRDPDRLRTVTVGPLSLAALHHLISQRTDQVLPRRELVQIVESSGGNPFFALEMARSTDPSVPGAAGMPDSLRALVRERLSRLGAPVREALLVASALAAPRVDLVDRAVGAGDADVLLSAAEDHGVVEVSPDGTVSFTHPLLARGIYAEASPMARRELHRRLSAVVDDLEERARHLALSTIGPDPEAVAALDAAAVVARRRGAPAAAAELLELAIALGARDLPRRVRAAHDHFQAGHPDRAADLLESAINDLPPGLTRAEALALLGTIRFEASRPSEAAQLLGQAFTEAADDARLRYSVAVELSYVAYNHGQRADSRAFARAAVDAAERTGEDGLVAEASAVFTVVRFLFGEPTDEAALRQALALEDHDRRSRAITWPTHVAAVINWWCGRPDTALALLQAVRQRCLERGADSDLWLVWFHAVPAALLLGDVATAAQYVEEAVAQAQLVGTDHARAHARGLQAALWAWGGEVENARTAADEALALFARGQVVTFGTLATGAVGMGELSLGDHSAAAERLVPAVEALISVDVGTSVGVPLLPDAVEALVAQGRLDEAEPFTAMIEAAGRRTDLARAEPLGARCRGLMLAAQGRIDEALTVFTGALAAHDRLPLLRYDRARTLLLLGRLQRRRRQRRAAHASLEQAAQLFDDIGCRQWARNARGELDRLGLRAGSGDALTPTELRIAELAASGATAREVAAALIVSPKTVEAHLTRIYRKLGIRTRAELGHHMARQASANELTERAET